MRIFIKEKENYSIRGEREQKEHERKEKHIDAKTYESRHTKN